MSLVVSRDFGREECDQIDRTLLAFESHLVDAVAELRWKLEEDASALLVHWRFERGGLDEFGNAGIYVSDIVGRIMHVGSAHLDILSGTSFCAVGPNFVLKATDGKRLKIMIAVEKLPQQSNKL